MTDEKEYSLAADAFGVAKEIFLFGLEEAERKTDRVFESRLSKWLSWKLLSPLQLQPDGHYFKSHATIEFENEWQGFETQEDAPKIKLGKFEMEI